MSTRSAPFSTAVDGWALSTLERALLQAFMALFAAWHLLMIGVLLASPGRPNEVLFLAGGHLLIGVLAATTAARNQRPLPVVILIVLLGWTMAAAAWHYSPSLDSSMTLGANWLINLTTAGAALVLPGRKALVLPLTFAVLLPVWLVFSQPEWGPEFAPAVVVTQVMIVAACLLGGRALRTFVTQADGQAQDAARRNEAATIMRTARQAAAESARTLHDTVINTLAAIANGLPTEQNISTVRELCANDVTVGRSLLATADTTQIQRLRFGEMADQLGLQLERSGLSDAALDAVVTELPTQAVAAISGASREALRNVAKHAHVTEVTIESHQSADGGLTIAIRDRGAGFDSTVHGGLGLSESVFARCQEAGIEATVTSALGTGTTVKMHYRPDLTDNNAASTDLRLTFATLTSTFQRRACWLWAAGVTGVGVVIEFVNRFGLFTMTWLMLGLIAAVSVAAWLASRSSGTLGWPMQVVLVIAAPAAWVLSLAGVDFGDTNGELWQTLGVTVPVMILLYMSTGPKPFYWAIGGFVGASLITAAILWHTGSPHAVFALVGAAAPGALIIALTVMRNTVARIGDQAALDEARALQSRLALARMQAASRARERWQVSGVQTSIDLLSTIAKGTADPTDGRIQESCAREERHLRQLLLLSPDLVQMGSWLAQASAEARQRGVKLSLRTGNLDAPDEPAARFLGELTVAAIQAMPSGSDVTVGIFPQIDGGCLTIVGASAHLKPELIPPWLPPGVVASHDAYSDQGIIEVAWENSVERRDEPAVRTLALA